MQVQNNKEEVPFAHYEEKFAALDPAEASKRCGVPFADGRFTVTLLGTNYEIRWPEYAISSDTEGAFALKNLPCQTFLLRFLLEGRAAEPSGSYKTFREMPWGEMYIGPYTGRVLTRAAFEQEAQQKRLARQAFACERGFVRRRNGVLGPRDLIRRAQQRHSEPAAFKRDAAAHGCFLRVERGEFFLVMGKRDFFLVVLYLHKTYS